MAYREGYLQAVRESICPLCGSEMTDKISDYSDWSDGHLLVVRDVPVRECQAGGHRFFWLVSLVPWSGYLSWIANVNWSLLRQWKSPLSS